MSIPVHKYVINCEISKKTKHTTQIARQPMRKEVYIEKPIHTFLLCFITLPNSLGWKRYQRQRLRQGWNIYVFIYLRSSEYLKLFIRTMADSSRLIKLPSSRMNMGSLTTRQGAVCRKQTRPRGWTSLCSRQSASISKHRHILPCSHSICSRTERITD